jgi:MFS family permease
MNYTETEINTVSAIGTVGQYLTALPVGMIFDRFGARSTIGCGTLLLFGGYFLMYNAIKGLISTHFIAVGTYMFFVGK